MSLDLPPLFPPTQEPPALPPPRTSRLASASLIVALISFPLGSFRPYVGAAAVILGAIAICRIAGKERMAGTSIAVTGIVLGSFAVNLTFAHYYRYHLLHNPALRPWHPGQPER